MNADQSLKALAERVRGRRLEDISRRDLEAIAADAGKRASEAALAAGLSITRFVDGKLMRVYPDGRIIPYQPESD
jgi:hypothetical protein